MKKSLVLPLLALLLLLGACGGAQSDRKPPYTAGNAKALVDAGAFSGVMEEVGSDTVLMIYGIDEATVKECACYMASNTSVNADEVTALVLTDEDAAKAAADACKERVEYQIDSCADYCPDQVPRLENAVILQRGATVLLAVGDPDKLPQALKTLNLD